MAYEEKFEIGTRKFVSRWRIDNGELEVRVFEDEEWIISFSAEVADSYKMEEAMSMPVIEQLKMLAKEQAGVLCERDAEKAKVRP